MKKTILLFAMVLTSTFAYSQKAIVASGGNSVGNNGSVSYSVGQIFYTSTGHSTGFILQGIQQSFEFSPLSNPDFKELTLEAITYPNPTQDKINLVLKNSDLKELTFRLFDVKGVEVSKGKVLQDKTTIGLKRMAKGVYILKVNHQNKELKTFKIIKK